MTAAWRRDLVLRPDDEGWPSPRPVARPPGLRSVGVGAWVENPTADTTVVFEGTALHPDAPPAAWTPLWSATVGAAPPAAASGPLFLGAVRWIRWRLSTPTAPTRDAVLHLAIDGDLPE